MLLSGYQKSEILIGTIIFPMTYFSYLYISHTPIMIWDIIWCTITLFLILLFRNFYINFNILQSQTQNFSLTI